MASVVFHQWQRQPTMADESGHSGASSSNWRRASRKPSSHGHGHGRMASMHLHSGNAHSRTSSTSSFPFPTSNTSPPSPYDNSHFTREFDNAKKHSWHPANAGSSELGVNSSSPRYYHQTGKNPGGHAARSGSSVSRRSNDSFMTKPLRLVGATIPEESSEFIHQKPDHCGSNQQTSQLQSNDSQPKDTLGILQGLGVPPRLKYPKPNNGKSHFSLASNKIARKLRIIYDKYGLSHVIPCVILLFYTIAAAGVLHAVEYPNELDLLSASEENRDIVRSRAIIEIQRLANGSQMGPQMLSQTLRQFEKDMEPLKVSIDIPWDMWGALFYIGTIFTTIGYGNIAARTTLGCALTIIFALFGIPLVLAILADFGKLLAYSANVLWKRAVRRARRKLVVKLKESGVNVPNAGRLPRSLVEVASGKHVAINMGMDESQAEEMDPIMGHPLEMTNSSTAIICQDGTVTAEHRDSIDSTGTGGTNSTEDTGSNLEDTDTVPLSIALCMCVGWMLLCAALFLLWEREWTYSQSFYFFFISLSTIGLGDITPNKPKLMLFNFWLVIIGLSLVSMLINVIQIKIEQWLYRMMKEMQEEYERAMAMGDCPERDEILQKIMKKQPWYMKQIAPKIMSEKQTEQLQNIAENAAAAAGPTILQTYKVQTNSKIVQTDEPSTVQKLLAETMLSSGAKSNVNKNLVETGVQCDVTRPTTSRGSSPMTPRDPPKLTQGTQATPRTVALIDNGTQTLEPVQNLGASDENRRQAPEIAHNLPVRKCSLSYVYEDDQKKLQKNIVEAEEKLLVLQNELDTHQKRIQEHEQRLLQLIEKEQNQVEQMAPTKDRKQSSMDSQNNHETLTRLQKMLMDYEMEMSKMEDDMLDLKAQAQKMAELECNTMDRGCSPLALLQLMSYDEWLQKYHSEQAEIPQCPEPPPSEIGRFRLTRQAHLQHSSSNGEGLSSLVEVSIQTDTWQETLHIGPTPFGHSDFGVQCQTDTLEDTLPIGPLSLGHSDIGVQCQTDTLEETPPIMPMLFDHCDIGVQCETETLHETVQSGQVPIIQIDFGVQCQTDHIMPAETSVIGCQTDTELSVCKLQHVDQMTPEKPDQCESSVQTDPIITMPPAPAPAPDEESRDRRRMKSTLWALRALRSLRSHSTYLPGDEGDAPQPDFYCQSVAVQTGQGAGDGSFGGLTDAGVQTEMQHHEQQKGLKLPTSWFFRSALRPHSTPSPSYTHQPSADTSEIGVQTGQLVPTNTVQLQTMDSYLRIATRLDTLRSAKSKGPVLPIFSAHEIRRKEGWLGVHQQNPDQKRRPSTQQEKLEVEPSTQLGEAKLKKASGSGVKRVPSAAQRLAYLRGMGKPAGQLKFGTDRINSSNAAVMPRFVTGSGLESMDSSGTETPSTAMYGMGAGIRQRGQSVSTTGGRPSALILWLSKRAEQNRRGSGNGNGRRGSGAGNGNGRSHSAGANGPRRCSAADAYVGAIGTGAGSNTGAGATESNVPKVKVSGDVAELRKRWEAKLVKR